MEYMQQLSRQAVNNLITKVFKAGGNFFCIDLNCSCDKMSESFFLLELNGFVGADPFVF